MVASFQNILEACHERWRLGSESIQRLLQKNMRNKRPKAKTIRSAIYGNMEFESDEMFFIESYYLQRLRHVSQMGLMHLVYPDARHSRFEHSLGVAHSLKSLLTADPNVRAWFEKRKTERRALVFAALLHDCGHGPFSHTTESLLSWSGLDATFRRPAPNEGLKTKPHERRCRDMILDADFHLANLGIESYGLRTALKQFGTDPESVVQLVVGNEGAPLLNLLSGDFDVDKMDYFRRDAFFTGTTGGGVDMEVIQKWVRVEKRNGAPAVAFDRRLVGHLLHLLYSREHVYSITAYHPVVRTADALLLVSGDLALRSLKPRDAADLYSNLELLDDTEFLALLEIAASDLRAGEGGLLRRILQRLRSRRLLKRLRTLSRDQFKQIFGTCIKVLEDESGGERPPELVYCRVSDIGKGKYTQHLVHARPQDDIVILDMRPEIGLARDTFRQSARELNTLENILVSDPTAKIASLANWINRNAGKGAAASMASALHAYKLAVWKALVLVPASLKFALQSSGRTDVFVKQLAETFSQPALVRPFRRTRSSWAHALELAGSNVRQWRGQLSQ
jgi:HD superfamily phosphohydrolase